MGASALRIARPQPGTTADQLRPIGFDVTSTPVAAQTTSAELAADSITAAMVDAVAVAYRNDQQARGLRAALARRQFTNYELVPETIAACEFLKTSGDVAGLRTIALYDLGASGLTVTVVDVVTGEVFHSERTSDISGDYLDSLIREQQIASGRITHPHDQAGLAALDAVCRQAKEQLTGTTAVAVPSEHGLVLISQENFEALIMLAVESSARLARDAIMRAEQPVQAVVVLGGCARIPLVAKVLGRWLGMPVLVPPEPESVVARGAAMLARPSRGALPTPADAGQAAAWPPADMAWSPDSMPTEILVPMGDRSPALIRGRELSLAGAGFGALVVVIAVAVGLGWGQHVLQEDATSKVAATTTPPPLQPHPTTVLPPVTAPESTNATMPPTATTEEWEPAAAAPTTQGPNTIQLPFLPPIVMPTIPPLLPPPPPPPGH
ncbi:Hsp70 family protein [Nocardia stercoris]|uniref:Hsp70 family protein n=1 Tax=Nocardia stercoris TaxID=2483361 RepID=UPI001F42BE47|nr:Hsp70 family protein [Nocardia stercoris]